MKKIILSLCTMLAAFSTAWADDVVTGLQIEMKDASKGYIQILFTEAPVVTHNVEAAQIIINAEGLNGMVLNMSDIKEMKFVEVNNPITSVESIFPQTDAKGPKGIYTLSGQKVQNVVKGQVYIINGTKVLVK